MSPARPHTAPARLGMLAALAMVAGLLAVLGSTAPATARTRYRVFHIPTSSSAPGRIVTAKNGNMWFVETKDATRRKVGRITPSGHLHEFTVSTAEFNQPEDIAASPDGTIWVLLDQSVVHLASNGDVTQTVQIPGSYNYATAIRVDRNGRPWVVWTDPDGHLGYIDHSGVFHTPANAPDCDAFLGDELGIGSDNHAWCAAEYGGGSVTRSNAAGTGGATYPIGDNRFGALSLAAGPTGRIWFAHSESGSWATPSAEGVVGFIRANGKVKRFNTGFRTAPDQIVRRPHTSQMWFVSDSYRSAIGHINPKGHGSIHTVGAYTPTALTFDHKGRIWFTDAEHNAIVRVSPKALMTSNIDPGSGSVLDPKARLRTGNFKKYKHPRHIRKHHTFTLRHNCPRHATTKCRARVKTVTKHRIHGKHRVIARPRTVKTAAGHHHTVRFKLTKKGRKIMRHHKVLKIRLRLYLPHHKHPSATRTIKLHR